MLAHETVFVLARPESLLLRETDLGDYGTCFRCDWGQVLPEEVVYGRSDFRRRAEIGYMYVVVATAISKTFQKSGTDRFAASSLASPTHRGQRGTFG
jgi:hypothetical protein